MRNTRILICIFVFILSSKLGLAQYDNSPKSVNQQLFVDTRDNQAYSYQSFGTQYWMTENLNFNCEGSFDYVNNSKIQTKTGRYYNIDIADLVCPSGWHLPTNNEWEKLASYLSNNYGPFSKNDGDWSVIGGILKSPKIRNNDELSLKDIGFNGLIAGYYGFSENGGFVLLMNDLYTAWWTSTPINTQNNFVRGIYKISKGVSELSLDIGNLSNAYMIRCVKNNTEME
jgi:uncharacterized protein (TIGR02145 family)